MLQVQQSHRRIPFASAPLTLRWISLTALLAAELLSLSLRFDTASISADHSWWSRLAGHLPEFLRVGLAAGAALLLILAPRLAAIAEEARFRAGEHCWRYALFWHLLTFGAVWQMTLAVFGVAEEGMPLPAGLAALWATLGAICVLLWLATMAPVRFWHGILRSERRAFLAAALAGLAAWAGGLTAQWYWKPLAEGTFWLSYHLLRLIYPHALYDVSDYVLGTPSFLVNIAPQCSGYEGIGLVGVFLALYLWLFRAEIRFPQAFLLFPFGALAIWLANAVRITALIAIGTSFSRDVALGGFHSQGGWIAFIAIALALILAARRLRMFARDATTRAPAERSIVVPALLVPLLVLMAAIMLTSAFNSGFDRLYPLRILAAGAALWSYRRVYRRWDWRLSWHAAAIGVAVFGIWLLLEPAADENRSALGTALASVPSAEAALWLAFRAAGSAIVIPLAEELAFRGYLLRRLAGQEGDDPQPGRFGWMPFLLSSGAFGLLHTRWLAGTLAGMAYAWAFYRRGRLTDAVAAHMTTNALIAVFVLAFGHWSLWA